MTANRYCPMCDEWMRQTECPKCGMPTDKALPGTDSDPVQRDWESLFGAALFNLYTDHMPCGDQLFSQRAATVRRMLAAMREGQS